MYRLDAIVSRLDAIVSRLVDWRPSLVGWRPLSVQAIVSRTRCRIGWRPLLVGWTPLFVGSLGHEVSVPCRAFIHTCFLCLLGKRLKDKGWGGATRSAMQCDFSFPVNKGDLEKGAHLDPQL